MRKTAIVYYYPKANRYSVNVLLAAIDKYVPCVDQYLVRDGEPLIAIVNELSRVYDNLVVAFSILTVQLPQILNTIRLLRMYKPDNVVLIAGGPHATGDPYGTLNLGFDYVFIGEAEESLIEFIWKLIEGDDPARVKGLVTRVNGGIVFTGRRKPINLDEYPPVSLERNLYNPIEITRGCPYTCAYCQTPYIHGLKPRHRSIECILYYTREMLKRGLKDIRFITPNSLCYGSSNGKTLELQEVEELLYRLRILCDSYGGRIFFGSFPSEVRPEFVTDESIRVLRKYVNNNRIIIGAQSGSDRILKLLHRGHTVDDVVNAVTVALKYGFIVDVDFIFGLPYETEEDIELTVNTIRKLIKLGARVHAHTFLPLPGTPLALAKPGTIHPKVRKILYKYLGRGVVYGEWVRQERLAQIICELRAKGVIRVKPSIGRYYEFRLS